MPGTTGGLADLANNKVIDTSGMDRNSKAYKKAREYNNMIFNARQDLDRQGRNYLTGNRKDSDRYRQNGGGNFGGGGGTDPTDPTDTGGGLMPSGTYLATQFNKNLGLTGIDPYQNQLYTGGPEQNYIAGGYWNPSENKFLSSPWGTQDLWQGAMPMQEGGPVRAPSSKVTNGGGGLFNFKANGF